MNINFPLVLVVSVAVMGVVLLIDYFFFKEKRVFAEEQLKNLQENGVDKRQKQISMSSLEKQAKDPVLVEFSNSFFPVLLLVLILRSFIVEPFKIPSSSMVPTLLVNDFILVNKFTYGIRLPVIRTKIFEMSEPQRGDVMVFFPPKDKRYFIKRVIGLPGDRIQVINNVLYINGEKMEQKLIEAQPPENPKTFVMEEKMIDKEQPHLIRKRLHPSVLGQNYEQHVPEGHYLMLGDNRDNSSDSRVWGFVPEANIVGKAFFVWMHWEKFLSLPKFTRSGTID